MSKQLGFASAFADARLGSNKKLEEIDRQIDWSVLEPLAQRVRPGTAGRPPYEALAMLKALYLQRLYDLSDPGLEEALLDRLSFRVFCGFSLEERTPDETTILRFRHDAAKAGVLEQCFAGDCAARGARAGAAGRHDDGCLHHPRTATSAADGGRTRCDQSAGARRWLDRPRRQDCAGLQGACRGRPGLGPGATPGRHLGARL